MRLPSVWNFGNWSAAQGLNIDFLCIYEDCDFENDIRPFFRGRRYKTSIKWNKLLNYLKHDEKTCAYPLYYSYLKNLGFKSIGSVRKIIKWVKIGSTLPKLQRQPESFRLWIKPWFPHLKILHHLKKNVLNMCYSKSRNVPLHKHNTFPPSIWLMHQLKNCKTDFPRATLPGFADWILKMWVIRMVIKHDSQFINADR